MKRISTPAYQALRDALPVVTWNKRPFESHLRTSLRDHPELLAGLNFTETKRVVADELVNRLIRHEGKYQETTLQLMLEISSMTHFPNLDQIKEEEDREQRLAEARTAVAHLKSVTSFHASHIEDVERVKAQRDAQAAQKAALKDFDDDVDALKVRFMAMHEKSDPHARGYDFESFLADLFLLYDLEPRLAYSVESEQIDGAFTFDTDDYILEARWRSEKCSRSDADVFAAKVKSKAKNAVGLFVSVNGFAKTFLDRFSEATPFITIDGTDLYYVLDRRVRLDDLLRAKKRHANETGSCFLPVQEVIR